MHKGAGICVILLVDSMRQFWYNGNVPICREADAMERNTEILLCVYLAVSLIAFVSYGRDKRLARQHKWRTPEAVLLALGFFGGSVGALLGMQVFRHKTKHWYFWFLNILGLLWQAGLLIALILANTGGLS